MVTKEKKGLNLNSSNFENTTIFKGCNTHTGENTTEIWYTATSSHQPELKYNLTELQTNLNTGIGMKYLTTSWPLHTAPQSYNCQKMKY